MKTENQLQFVFSAHHLMRLCGCTKLQENVINDFKVMEKELQLLISAHCLMMICTGTELWSRHKSHRKHLQRDVMSLK